MATTKEPQAAVEGVADQAQGAGQQVAGGGKQVADQAQGAGQQVADQAQGAGQQVADQAQEAGGKATGQDDSDDDGVYKQLKKVATTALVAALGPAVKKGVTGLAEQAVKKGPEPATRDLLPKVAKAGGAKKIASVVLDKLKGG